MIRTILLIYTIILLPFPCNLVYSTDDVVDKDDTSLKTTAPVTPVKEEESLQSKIIRHGVALAGVAVPLFLKVTKTFAYHKVLSLSETLGEGTYQGIMLLDLKNFFNNETARANAAKLARDTVQKDFNKSASKTLDSIAPYYDIAIGTAVSLSWEMVYPFLRPLTKKTGASIRNLVGFKSDNEVADYTVGTIIWGGAFAFSIWYFNLSSKIKDIGGTILGYNLNYFLEEQRVLLNKPN